MMKNVTPLSWKITLVLYRGYFKKPPENPRRPKIFSGNIKIRFLHKILSLKKLVPLICPGGARGPL